MEAIITIIIMALAALSIGNGMKKVSQNKPGQRDPNARPGQQNPYSPAQRPTRPVRPNWQQTLPPELREMLGMDQPQQQRRSEGTATEATPSNEGTNYASEEGMSRASQSSYGGSLPPPEDGFATVSIVQKAESAPAPMPAASEPASRLSPEELRRAVILSEVLKGPVALRNRGYIR